jgi:hypothetical protein
LHMAAEFNHLDIMKLLLTHRTFLVLHANVPLALASTNSPTTLYTIRCRGRSAGLEPAHSAA